MGLVTRAIQAGLQFSAGQATTSVLGKTELTASAKSIEGDILAQVLGIQDEQLTLLKSINEKVDRLIAGPWQTARMYVRDASLPGHSVEERNSSLMSARGAMFEALPLQAPNTWDRVAAAIELAAIQTALGDSVGAREHLRQVTEHGPRAVLKQAYDAKLWLDGGFTTRDESLIATFAEGTRVSRTSPESDKDKLEKLRAECKLAGLVADMIDMSQTLFSTQLLLGDAQSTRLEPVLIVGRAYAPSVAGSPIRQYARSELRTDASFCRETMLSTREVFEKTLGKRRSMWELIDDMQGRNVGESTATAVPCAPFDATEDRYQQILVTEALKAKLEYFSFRGMAAWKKWSQERPGGQKFQPAVVDVQGCASGGYYLARDHGLRIFHSRG